MCSVTMRQNVEKEIVRRFVTDAIKAGYRLAVSLERGYDVDTMLLGSRSVERVMNEAFAGDDCHIFVQPAKGPTVEKGQVVSEGWVYCVFGNDGWDVISDYTTSLDELLTETNKIVDHYSRMP